MDNKQKQRVIGIIFLVVLAVVAIPAFLKRSANTNEMANVQGTASDMPVEPLKEENPAIDQNQNPNLNPNSVQNPSPNGVETLQPSPMPPLESSNQQAISQEPPVNTQGPVVDMPPQNQEPASTATPSPDLNSNVSEAPDVASPVNSANMVNTVAPSAPVITNTPASVPTTTATPVTMPKHVTHSNKAEKTESTEAHAVKVDWVIRLAVLSSHSGADKLIGDMKKQGYTGHIEEINTYKGMVYNITMKTHASKKEVDKLAQKLNTVFHIKVMVSKQR